MRTLSSFSGAVALIAALSACSSSGGQPDLGTKGDATGRVEGGGGGDGRRAEAGSSDGRAPTGPYQAKLGAVCPLETTIGIVTLSGFGATPSIQASVHDRPSPWIGKPTLSTPTCGYHRYITSCASSCPSDKTCSIDGVCVAVQRTFKDATLTVSTGGKDKKYTADPTTGDIYGALDLGTATSSFAMALRWGTTEVLLDPMPVASAKLSNLKVEIAGDSMLPGALDATWTPSTEGAFVRTTIPINHHAAAPTFTECVAADSSGAFHADAEMINPLATVTGLEFQGVEHVHLAAAVTPAGCVEFRFGEQLYVTPQ